MFLYFVCTYLCCWMLIHVWKWKVTKTYQSNKYYKAENTRDFKVKAYAQWLAMVSTGRRADCAWNRIGYCEGGGGGDGGGGDPVEEEPSLPVPVPLRANLVLFHRFSFNFPLEGGRLNCSFGFHPVQGDGSPLPPCAGCYCSWGHITDGSSLQGGGGGARADEKQLGLPCHLLTQPETFRSVLGKYNRTGTYTALPKKAKIRMIWFILNLESCLIFTTLTQPVKNLLLYSQ